MKHTKNTVLCSTAPLANMPPSAAAIFLGMVPRPSPIPSDLAELEAAQAVLDGDPFLDDWLDPEPDLIAAPPSSERRPTLLGTGPAPALPAAGRACLVAAGLGPRPIRAPR